MFLLHVLLSALELRSPLICTQLDCFPLFVTLAPLPHTLCTILPSVIIRRTPSVWTRLGLCLQPSSVL